MIGSREKDAQITIEFTFSMVIVLVMVFSLIMIFRWVGYDLGWRRVHHDELLIKPVERGYDTACPLCPPQEGPIEQIDPYFHRPSKMNSAWGL